MARGHWVAVAVGLGLAGCFGSSSQPGGDAGDAAYDSPAATGDDATSPFDATGGPDAVGDAPGESTIALDAEAGSPDVTAVDAAQDVGADVSSDAPMEASADSPGDSQADAAGPACDGGLASCGGACVPLTSEPNCGACNRTCFGYGCNSDGTCAVHSLLASPGLVWDAAYASGAVYLMSVDGSPPTLYSLVRVPTDGSAPVTMYSEPTGSYPGGLATDGTSLYWSVNAAGVLAMWSLPLGAAAGTTRTQVFLPITQPRWLRFHAGYFYWVSNTYGPGTGIYARALNGAGGDASDPGSEIVTDNAYSDFTVTDDALYWLSNQSGILLRTAPLAGGAPSTVTTVINDPAPMAVDGTYVYWSYNGSSTTEGVYRYTAGGSVQPVTTPGSLSTFGVLVSGNLAYFGVGGSSTVYSVPKTGGTPTALADTANAVSLFVGADAQFVYGVTFGGGPLIQIPR